MLANVHTIANIIVAKSSAFIKSLGYLRTKCSYKEIKTKKAETPYITRIPAF